MTVRVLAPAKINLALHVTGQRADGYHELDTLVAFGPAYDVVHVTAAATNSLEISGPEAGGLAAGGNNLILRAAEAVDVGSAAFQLEKNLPVASGIGGGSTDAAAAVRGLLALYGGANSPRADQVAGLADRLLDLGADIPMCLVPQSLRAQGIGEVLTPLALPPMGCVLVNPRVQISTPDVFKSLTQKDNPPLPNDVPDFATPQEAISWLAGQRNDLQAAASVGAPVIHQVLDALRNQPGCGLARMSGSGATCFGLFANAAKAQQAALDLAAVHPDWWVSGGVLAEERQWAVVESAP